MEIEFVGAAREVTGSCHLVRVNGHTVHAGRLPLLAANGYDNAIWCTAATRDLCAIMLADSANIQERDAQFLAKRQKEVVEPLYTLRDAARVAELTVGVP